MRLIFSHLDRTSLVNKGFMIQQKDYRFIKNQHLFISKDWRGGSLCLWRINLRELFKFIVYVFFVFIVFCHFLQLYPQYCPSIKKLVCMLEVIFFSCTDSKWEIPFWEDGPAQVGNSPHIAHGLCQRCNKLSYTHPFHLCNLGSF